MEKSSFRKLLEYLRQNPLSAVITACIPILLAEVAVASVEITNPYLESSALWIFSSSICAQGLTILVSVWSLRKVFQFKSEIVKKRSLRTWIEALYWIPVAGAGYYLLDYLQMLGSKMFPTWSLGEYPEIDILHKSQSVFEVSLMMFSMVIATPIVEEIFFRGFCYRILRLKYGKTSSIAVLSLMFVLFHPIPSWVPMLIVATIILCLSFEHRKNLLVPIIIHSIMNLLSLLSLGKTT